MLDDNGKVITVIWIVVNTPGQFRKRGAEQNDKSMAEYFTGKLRVICVGDLSFKRFSEFFSKKFSTHPIDFPIVYCEH